MLKTSINAKLTLRQTCLFRHVSTFRIATFIEPHPPTQFYPNSQTFMGMRLAGQLYSGVDLCP